MKKNRLVTAALVPFSVLAAPWRAGLLWVLLLSGGIPPAGAAEFQWIHSETSAVATNLPPLRHSPRWNRLNLSLSLPLRNREGLTNLLQQLYDPASTNYHRFLTPEQFTERFGPTEQDYEAVVTFARTHGLAVTARHRNRTLLSVRATVADVERAFHVTINEYQHPVESRTFFAPDREPSVDLAPPLLAVGGMDNYVIPRPCLKPIASGQAGANLTGSGPSGAYVGKDFRAAYVPGAPETGTGQTVGLLEFDSGYYQSDITAYEALAGLPNVPVSPVLLDGYNGGAGGGNDEVSLDIEMAISMAPGLSGVLVYEGSTTDDILNRMATDNLAKQIGASWTYGIDAGSEQAFLQMAAQGQSFFNASGDSDAYPGAVPTPSDDPNITVVGGTTLTTTGPGGAWSAETVWNWGTEYGDNGVGSSGGISTRNAIPAWQQGINMSANQGSTTMRNLPDVAMTADNVYVLYGNGQAGAFGGTSCATPLWAAFISLVNQLALTNGEPAAGFINPLGLWHGQRLEFPGLHGAIPRHHQRKQRKFQQPEPVLRRAGI
jgi:subtilase family serine protease